MSRRVSGALTLLILDGLGLSRGGGADAVRAAKTPWLCQLWRGCPRAVLRASGEAVGLYPGQMGNSNVGHLHLGAGRVILHEGRRIDRAIRRGELFRNEALLGVMERVRSRGAVLHFMGLVSDGRVHSDLEHLAALIRMARSEGLGEVAVHAFLDGRDVPPCSASKYLERLEREVAPRAGHRVATVAGRYYAMDRDNRWDRTAAAVAAILRGEGRAADSCRQALEESYSRGQTDEFVQPTVVGGYAGYRPGDAFLFFNFRADRARQLVQALLDPGLSTCDVAPLVPPADLVTMVQYGREFDCPVAFAPVEVTGTLGEWVSRVGYRQLRLAETEKYAHVTYFFNGGREEPFPGEQRVLIPSPPVATYDMKPEMSAERVTDAVVDGIGSSSYDLIVANLANLDMVGHTGDFDAAVRAAAAVDACLGRVAGATLEAGGMLLVTADHGNAETMVDADGEPHTAHTANDVPFILVAGSDGWALRESGGLADVAPTVLDLLGIRQPELMTGRSLLLDGNDGG
ncbi:MAG: 2,3-bisphosphoglycerate-independent phosphoglycerate mutase [Bacillota bacterium]